MIETAEAFNPGGFVRLSERVGALGYVARPVGTDNFVFVVPER
jgi:hypothetical protein